MLGFMDKVSLTSRLVTLSHVVNTLFVHMCVEQIFISCYTLLKEEVSALKGRCETYTSEKYRCCEGDGKRGPEWLGHFSSPRERELHGKCLRNKGGASSRN